MGVELPLTPIPDTTTGVVRWEMNTIDPATNQLTTNPPASRSYAFCSDTKFFEELAIDIKDVSLLYHESTFLDDKKDRAKETFHSTANQAAQMAILSNAQKLVLGHFSARYGNLDEFLNEAKPLFPNTELAIEGTVFIV